MNRTQLGPWKRDEFNRGFRNEVTGAFLPDPVVQGSGLWRWIEQTRRSVGARAALEYAARWLDVLAQEQGQQRGRLRVQCGCCSGTGWLWISGGGAARRCVLCAGSGQR